MLVPLLFGGGALALFALTRSKAAPPVTSPPTKPPPSPTPPAPSGGSGGGVVADIVAAVPVLAPVVVAIVGGGGVAAATVPAVVVPAVAAGGGTTVAAGGVALGAGNVTLLSGGLAGGALIGGAVLTTAAGVAGGAVLGTGTVFGTAGGGIAGGLSAFTALPSLAGAQIGREIHKLFGGDGTGASASGVVIQLGAAATLGLASVLGGLAVVGFAPLVLAVFGVVSAIEDSNRLRWGQAGALADWRMDFSTAQTMFNATIAKACPNSANGDVAMYATACALGWANQMNQQRYAIWKIKPRAIFSLVSDHLKYGHDRGYWYATPFGNLNTPINYESSEAANARGIAATSGNSSAFSNAVSAGAVAANVRNYQWAMQQPRGIGKSDVAHFDYWKNAGFFFGARTGDSAELDYDSKKWTWK